jgi:hypothetical protein
MGKTALKQAGDGDIIQTVRIHHSRNHSVTDLKPTEHPLPARFQFAPRWFQWVLLVVYVLGFAAMLALNLRCYAGTYIGQVGWALIWPFSMFGYIVEFGFQLDNAIVADSCPLFIQEAAKGVIPR